MCRIPSKGRRESCYQRRALSEEDQAKIMLRPHKEDGTCPETPEVLVLGLVLGRHSFSGHSKSC